MCYLRYLCAIDVPPMCYLCATDVLLMCYLCATYVLLMCYLRVIFVLPMCYLCAIYVLPMCYRCVTYVLYMCHESATYMLFIMCRATYVLLMCYLCSTYNQSLRAIRRAESRRSCKVRGKRAHVQIAPQIVGRPTEPPARYPDPVAHHPLSGIAAVGSCRCRFSPTHTVVCNPLRAHFA